tara:strand:+ start:21 stop:956 length:936 start_codon:yes stop_codon:yes gene_type:complete
MDNLTIQKKYIFIGGTGRCGTNITKDILTKSEVVGSLPFEHRFIIDPNGIIDFYNSFNYSWSPYMSDKKLKNLIIFLKNLSQKNFKKTSYIDWELSKWFPNFDLRNDELFNNLIQFKYTANWPGSSVDDNIFYFTKPFAKEKLKSILSDYIINNFNDYLDYNKKSCFVEDNTWNILYANELFELVPNSKLLHLVRDPRDVISSFMHQDWCPHDFGMALEFYKSIIERWFKLQQNLPDNFYRIIKFEDLVNNKIETIKKICLFSEIEFDKKMLEIQLKKANIGRWKEHFNSKQKNILNKELNSVIHKLNYSI